MTSKEAKSILNVYRNKNYNSTFKDELELAKAIDTILPKYDELESRDTPMKLKSHNNGRLYCGICGKSKQHDYGGNENVFCGGCGQRIDWNKLRNGGTT